MQGAALRNKRQLDVATFTAWHTALFALNGYWNKGKLAGNKSLSDLLGDSEKRQPSQALQNARVIHFFQTLKAKGVPIEITRH